MYIEEKYINITPENKCNMKAKKQSVNEEAKRHLKRKY
jgi:hypothetical protein